MAAFNPPATVVVGSAVPFKLHGQYPPALAKLKDTRPLEPIKHEV